MYKRKKTDCNNSDEKPNIKVNSASKPQTWSNLNKTDKTNQ